MSLGRNIHTRKERRLTRGNLWCITCPTFLTSLYDPSMDSKDFHYFPTLAHMIYNVCILHCCDNKRTEGRSAPQRDCWSFSEADTLSPWPSKNEDLRLCVFLWFLMFLFSNIFQVLDRTYKLVLRAGSQHTRASGRRSGTAENRARQD